MLFNRLKAKTMSDISFSGRGQDSRNNRDKSEILTQVLLAPSATAAEDTLQRELEGLHTKTTST